MEHDAFYLDEQGNRRAVAVLLLIAACVLALGIAPFWRIGNDSALYVGIARSLAVGDGYSFAGHAQTSIPPAAPLYMGLVYKLCLASDPQATILDVVFWLNAAMALCGMAAIVAAFLLALELSSLPVAVAVLALVVTSRTFFEFSIQPLTDAPFALVTWLALLFTVRYSRRGGAGNLAAASAFLALAPLVRVFGIALVFSVAAYFLYRYLRRGRDARDGRLALAAVPAILLIAIFTPFLLIKDPASFTYLQTFAAHRSVFDIAREALRNAPDAPGNLFEAVFTFESAGGAWALFFLFVLIGAAAAWRRGVKLPAVYCVVYVLLAVASGPPRIRYYIPLLPFVFLFMAYGAIAISAWLERRTMPFRRRTIQAGFWIFGFILAINTWYVGREVVFNFSDDFYTRTYEHGQYFDYIEAASDLIRTPPPGRVMALQNQVVCALAGVDTAPLPYSPGRAWRPAPAQIARYVQEQKVKAILVDLRDKQSTQILVNFMRIGPMRWRLARCYSNLELFILDY